MKEPKPVITVTKCKVTQYAKPKPTGAQLYRAFMRGYSMAALSMYSADITRETEAAIRAYLRRRDKRERRVAR